MEFNGVAASKGYAIGNLFVQKKTDISETEYRMETPELEKQKLKAAISISLVQLEELKELTKRQIGETEAEIFDCHMMILEDAEFSTPIFEKIGNEKIGAYKATGEVIDMFKNLFLSMDNEYMHERAADFEDVGKRIKRILVGKLDNEVYEMSMNSVLYATDLTPSDTAMLDREKVIAFVTSVGGYTSHSSIMARSIGIPTVVGVGDISEFVLDGTVVIVDGFEGRIILNPSDELLELYKEKSERHEENKILIRKNAARKAVTSSGREVVVAANIGSILDVNDAIENGAESIGLFRTEFMYMECEFMPTEEVKFEAYKTVVESMHGKPVLIRTLDIGGDKELPYLKQEKEDNPFLGLRALRLCLKEHAMFKVQLRAILRASAFGKIQLMFPMIGSLNELFEAKNILEECKVELRNEKISFDEAIEVGMMIEIPAAALAADVFAKHVDFFSIGTNDLIQYTLAIDRMNPSVSYLYDPLHESVLKLIKMTIEAAHENGIWCGMCGEMAADHRAIPILIDMGIDELSMCAPSIPEVKSLIRTLV